LSELYLTHGVLSASVGAQSRTCRYTSRRVNSLSQYNGFTLKVLGEYKLSTRLKNYYMGGV